MLLDVSALMLFHVTLVGERFLRLVTCTCVLWTASVQMTLQGNVTWKIFLTCITSTMNVYMRLQDLLPSERFLTHITCKQDVHYHEYADGSSCYCAGWKISYAHHKKKDALHYECWDASSSYPAIWKTSYAHHMNTDALHYEWVRATSRRLGNWKVFYTLHVKVEAVQYGRADDSTHPDVWKISYAQHYECAGLSSNNTSTRTVSYIHYKYNDTIHYVNAYVPADSSGSWKTSYTHHKNKNIQPYALPHLFLQ
jgi:hypothetical protein